MASGPGLHDTNVSIYLFRQEANISIQGRPQICTSCENMVSLNFHSTFPLKCLDSILASLLLPGMCVSESQISLSLHQSQKLFARLLHCSDFIPPILFKYATVHVLSDFIKIWKLQTDLQKALIAWLTGNNSRKLI